MNPHAHFCERIDAQAFRTSMLRDDPRHEVLFDGAFLT